MKNLPGERPQHDEMSVLDNHKKTAGYTELPYPQLSQDYNQGMNSCDVTSQVSSYYSVSRYSHLGFEMGRVETDWGRAGWATWACWAVKK